MLTPYEQLVEEWKDCQRCPLWRGRQRVVMGRGTIPADILFVVEAPGESEDSVGLPFYGPAGDSPSAGLDRIIRNSVPPSLRWAIFNLVGCIPREDLEEGTGKSSQPPPESVEACKPRLTAFITICQPRLIVAVGNEARDYLEQGYTYSIPLPRGIYQAHIPHPAYVLRQNTSTRNLLTLRSEATVRSAIEFMLNSALDGPKPLVRNEDIPF